MAGRVRRGMWFALGWVAVAVGTVGIVVPGLPTTGFFVLAAAAFSRSSPRFEQWVLDRPGVGPLVRDYRAGLGMPWRAKLTAVLSIGFAVSLSAFLGFEGWSARLGLLLVGLIGIAYVGWRVPGRPRVETARWAPISHWFERAAIAETATWLALLVAMAVKYVGRGAPEGVAVTGLVHGLVVLGYVAVTLVAARRLRWGTPTVVKALLSSVPPLGTVWFEAWASSTRRLDRPATVTR